MLDELQHVIKDLKKPVICKKLIFMVKGKARPTGGSDRRHSLKIPL
jgi:hypothetical protein